MRLTNVSNPAVIGYEWSTEDGRYQVWQSRYATNGAMWYSTEARPVDGEPWTRGWSSTSIANPERFTSVKDAAEHIAGVK